MVLCLFLFNSHSRKILFSCQLSRLLTFILSPSENLRKPLIFIGSTIFLRIKKYIYCPEYAKSTRIIIKIFETLPRAYFQLKIRKLLT